VYRTRYSIPFIRRWAFPCRMDGFLKARRFPLDEERRFQRFYASRTCPQARFGVALGWLLLTGLAYGEDSKQAFQLFLPTFCGLCLFQSALLRVRHLSAAALGMASLGLVWTAGAASHAESRLLDSALLQLGILNALGMIVRARLEARERTLFRFRRRYLEQTRAARKERLSARMARDEAMLARSDRWKLAAATEEKERFLSAAYHDLQQPLSIIGLYVRAAKSKLEKAPEPALYADLSIIEGAGQDIALMFKGVREAWESGGAEPTIEPVNLNIVFDEIERELRERAGRKSLVFRLRKRMRPPVWVCSDRMLLKRALSNLVSNAIKYTERGGVVVGAVSLSSRVRIDVWDTGIGIPAEFQTRIFDEYFQVRNPGGDRRRGLGLGLSIVRRIEKNLPGHCLSFRSEPGKGSRFSLEVPIAFDSAANPGGCRLTPLSPPVDEVLEGKYVVIVENEHAILDGLVQTIRGVGCIAEGAGSAEAARRLFAERDRCPDVLVTGWRLRCGQTGLDVVAALRERFEWATDVPVLFTTGGLAPGSMLAGFEGSFEIYRKPIAPDAVLDRLRGLVTRPPPESRPVDRSPPAARKRGRAGRSRLPVECGSPP
jgi:signal transduction histidine kinase/CheY-like chemotaxis protein